MPTVMLLNGPPGIGKSTLAAALADDLAREPTEAVTAPRRQDTALSSPLPLALDVDRIKHAFGAWDTDTHASGLQARRLALAMIDRHLRDGHDVIVGQYLARLDFVAALEHGAHVAGCRFVHVLLDVPADVLAGRLAERDARPTLPEHATNAALTRGSDVEDLLRSLDGMRDRIPSEHVVDASGPIEQTVQALRALLG